MGRPGGNSGPVGDLRFLPKNAAVVGYADVHDIVTSGLRQRLLQSVPNQATPKQGARELETQTGIHLETDVDRVVGSVVPQGDGVQPSGLMPARGGFNEVKIESVMREHGAHVEDYNGHRIIVGPPNANAQNAEFGLTFLEPGLAAAGSVPLVRGAIDRQRGGENVTDNEALMKLVPAPNTANAWAVGQFDALKASGRVPPAVAERIPAISLFSISGHVDDAFTGVVRVEARDEEAATALRDVVRGFLSLAKLQAGANPRFESVVQSLQLGGEGKAVALSFAVTGDVFDGWSLPIPAPRRGERATH